MKKLVENILEDMSTKKVFQYRVSCEHCGTEYFSRPVKFSKAGIVPATQGKEIIYEAIYEQEHRAARDSALRSVSKHMNYCPICKRIVCDRCFLICDDLDMCKECAAQLEENGSPVYSGISEAVIG